ncbi:hypothetical protein ACX12E_02620 [Paenibacillus vandeheii]
MKRTKTSRTMMVTSTMALTIALGGGLFAHSVANADPAASASGQTKTDSASTSNSHTFKSADGKSAHGQGFGRYSDELASVLGMTADELKEARKAGSTIAEVAASKNVDVQTVIDTLVAAQKTELQQRLTDGKLTQTQFDERLATLTQRVTDLVNGNLPEVGAGGRGRGGFGGPGAERYTEELASVLGITTDELKEAREAGSTIAEIAAAKNVDVQTVIDKLVAAQKANLQQKLTDGKLTQAQYDERAADITQRVTDLINGKLSEDREGHGHGAKRDGESKTTTAPDSGKANTSASSSSTDPA